MADKKFTLQFDFEGNIGPIKTAVDGLKKSLSDIKIPDNIGTSLEKTLGRLTSELQVFEAATKDSFHDLSDIKTAEKSFNKIVTLLNQLNIQSKSVTGLDPKKFLPQETIDRVKKLEKNWESLQKEVGKQDQITKQIEQQTKAIKEQEAALKELEAKREVLTDDIKGQKAQRKKLIQSRDADAQSRNEIVAKMTELEGQKGGKTSAEYKLLNQELARLGQAIKNADKEIDALSAGIDRNATQQRKLKVQIEQVNESFEKQKTELQNLQNLSLTPKGLTELRTELAELKEVKIDEIPTDLKELQTVINSLTEEELEDIATSLTKIKNAADDLPGSVVKGREALEDMRDAGEGLQRTADEISNIKQRVLEFFSITNSIQLFKRAVQEAFKTVKELDAVMTETAVVTDFTVGDMWDKLPVYSKQATALGASIKDLYSATTLYYQQGLETNAAMGVGVETMKMARIANMDAADATQAMTAALRGFNMEVNELNAQKVNDVYSELAAITAADTSQIATAMSKTASIAASANMEFETTAALLSQIIETTQEAPETAGTAMKTIIARFTEVKQLFDEGQLKGQDTEGEEIDINKIDGALKSVGISLKDFLNGTKGIDDIFLELASKWDTLDLATQRYIATMAAGSRQQSRFIAMMSNYDRTMELVTAANNSAGASQEQFDKTLESLEAKLQKLSNAWDEFVMGLANNEIIKLGVDLLTGLLETINNVTSALSGGNGLVKSIISLVTVIGALKGGKSLFDNLFGGTAKQIGEIDLGDGKKGAIVLGRNLSKQAVVEGQKAGKSFAQAFKLSSGFELKNFLGSQVPIYSKQAKILWFKDTVQFIKGAQASIFKNTEGVGDKIAEMNEINSALARQEISFEQAKAKAEEYGLELISSGKHEHQFNVIGKETTLNLKNIGTAAIAAGSAITLLGELFKKIGAEKAGETIQKIGTAITAVGSAIAAITPILNTFGITIGSFGIAVGGTVVASLGAIAAVAGPLLVVLGALVGIFIAVRNASPEYQLKKAAEAAEHAGEAANSAAEAYMNLKSSLDSIEEKETTLENLTTGTQEWRDAVSELNNEMLSLIEKYPELAQYVESVNGVLKFTDDEAVEQIMAQYESNKTKAKAAEMAAKIEVERKQQGVGYSELSAETKNLATQALVGTATEYLVNSDGKRYTHDEFIAAQGEYGIDAETAETQWNNAILETDIDYEQDTIDLAKAIASGNWDEEQVEALGGKDSEAFLELKKLGQEIIASEAAIKVFTNSLIDSALTTAEISNENAENMRNMYDTETIEAMIEKAEGKIDLSDEQVKKDYAKYMGYDYENGKFYSGEGEDKKEVTVLDKDIKSQMAAIAVQDDMAKKATKLSSILPGLEKSSNLLDVAFSNIIEKADGAALTLSDLETLEKAEAFDEEGKLTFNEDGTGFVNKYIQELYSKVADVYDPETFARMMENAYQSGKEARDYSSKKLGSMGLSGDLFSKANIDTGSLSGIVNELYDVFLTSGKQVTQNLGSSLNTILSGIEDPEQAQIFADALEMIDWSDKDQVEGFSETLLDLGFDAAKAGMDVSTFDEDINSLEQEIITAAKSTKTFNLDNLREEIKSTEDLVKDLKSREDTERTFTKEERDLMVGADVSLTGQFIATGIDEFVYVGNSIETLITALNANTTALLSEYGEQVTHNAEMSDKWQNLADNGAMWTNSQNEYQVLSSIAQSGSLEGYDVEGVIGIMEKAGMGVDSGRSLGGYTPSQLAEIIMADYNQYGSELARNENAAAYDDYNTYMAQIETSKTNAVALQQNLNQEEENKVVSQQASEQDAKKYTDALTAQAQQLGINQSVIDEFNKSLEANGGVLDDNTAAILSNAIADKEATQRLTKTIDKVKDITDEYDDFTNILDSDVQTIGEAFGLEDLEVGSENFDFIKDNLELIEKAISGDVEAMSQFQNMLAQQYGVTIDATTGFVDMSAIIAATGEVEQSAIAAMNALIQAGAFEIETVEVEQDGEYDVPIIDPITGLISGFEKKYYEAGQTYQVVKPVDAPQVREASGNYGGGGGGGGGGSEPKKWENPYDEFYNTVEKLNEELRTREKLERRYQKLLDNTNTKASDLVKNVREQLDSLQLELKTRQELLAGRERQMADIEREYSDLSSYASYNEEKQVIEIDWTKIEALDGSTDEELTSRIEEYIGKLEEQQDLIEEEQDSIAEIEDAVKEIREQGKDEYFDLEGQIKEALEKARQEEIDKLSEINDSINDTNARLLDAMQSSIDKYRQDRENERTEEELSDKQRRLAYLQQDTSGANDLEILQLQEEIEQGQEDYTDTLIDQKINELQEQNDKAAEQRQQQIDLLQAQLDQYLESGEVWQDVYALMDEGINADGGLIRGSDLETLLQDSANFKGMSELGKVKWLEELENNLAEALKWLQVGNSTKALLDSGELKKGQKVTFTTSDGKKVTGTLNEDGSITTKDGKTYKDVYKNYDGTYVTKEKFQEPDPPKPSKPKEPEPEAPKLDENIKKGVSAAIWNGNYGWGNDPYRSERLKEVFGENDIQENYVEKYVMSGYTGKISDYSYANMKKKFKKFKTGGLADFTGPAWLDGTKSKPEYILNADQTKSFFQLVDVLGSLKSGASQSSQITGDSIYDVDINVESIGSDYDVEQLASTIKRMINDDARYRNNNAINLQR